MNILLINHYAGSKRHGMEYRPFYMAREWIKLGHRVTIVAASQSHVRVEQPRLLGSLTEENVEGVRYVWLKTPRYSGNGLRRALNMFAFVAQLRRHYKRVVGGSPPHAVIASSTYPLDIFPAHRIARRYGARLVFEVHDLWPLTPVQIGGMSPWHPFVMLLQCAEDYAYRHANRVVSILPNACEYMRQRGMAPEKFVHIPNGISVGDWQQVQAKLPQPHADCLEMLKQGGRFIVGYLGGHQRSNALDAILDAAELLRDQPVAFVLVGHGTEKQRLQQRAGEQDLKNVVFLPPVPKNSVPTVMAAMDALYLGLKNEPLFRFGISPNKLIDYMMAAKPVIHSVQLDDNLVATSGCGFSCPGEDPQAVAGAVLRLMELSPAERAAMGQRGKDYVTRYHQYPYLASRFVEALA